MALQPRRPPVESISMSSFENSNAASPNSHHEERKLNSQQSSLRHLTQTPSFASKQACFGNDFQEPDSLVGLIDLKQRLAELENVSAQQSDMITLTIKDLYRFCHDTSERQVQQTEYIVHEAFQEFQKKFDHMLN